LEDLEVDDRTTLRWVTKRGFTWDRKSSVAVSCKLSTRLRVLKNVKYFLADRATVSFSTIIMLPEVGYIIIICRHVVV
jgi:hypothetical protein